MISIDATDQKSVAATWPDAMAAPAQPANAMPAPPGGAFILPGKDGGPPETRSAPPTHACAAAPFSGNSDAQGQKGQTRNLRRQKGVGGGQRP